MTAPRCPHARHVGSYCPLCGTTVTSEIAYQAAVAECDGHDMKVVESMSGHQRLHGTDATVDHLVCQKCGYEEWD